MSSGRTNRLGVPVGGIADTEDAVFVGANDGVSRQGHGGDNRACIGLVEVRTHTSDVTDVVTDVVGDSCRVTRVVFGDAGFDFAHEVRANVGSLGVDTTADAGEEGDR